LYSTSGGRWGGIDIKLWDPKGQDYIMAKTMAGRPQPVKQRGESKYSYYDRLGDWKRLQETIMAPGQLIGKLSVEIANDFPLKRAVQVNTITVDEDYRGMNLAKALYGIVLTTKRPLLAGSSQTPGGRRNWVSLANIPGVQMKGYVSIDEGDLEPFYPNEMDGDRDDRYKKEHNKDIGKQIDIIMGKLGGQHIGRNRLGDDFFAFDVRPNATSKELEAVVKTKLSQLYSNYESNTGLYAIWTGQA